ncbi:hypothetical protein LXL04_005129 [Taraxacum kok-saghyz]
MINKLNVEPVQQLLANTLYLHNYIRYLIKHTNLWQFIPKLQERIRCIRFWYIITRCHSLHRSDIWETLQNYGQAPSINRSAGELRLYKDFTELSLPRNCEISFPNGEEDFMVFDVAIKPNAGFYSMTTKLFIILMPLLNLIFFIGGRVVVGDMYPHYAAYVKCLTKVVIDVVVSIKNTNYSYVDRGFALGLLLRWWHVGFDLAPSILLCFLTLFLRLSFLQHMVSGIVWANRLPFDFLFPSTTTQGLLGTRFFNFHLFLLSLTVLFIDKFTVWSIAEAGKMDYKSYLNFDCLNLKLNARERCGSSSKTTKLKNSYTNWYSLHISFSCTIYRLIDVFLHNRSWNRLRRHRRVRRSHNQQFQNQPPCLFTCRCRFFLPIYRRQVEGFVSNCFNFSISLKSCVEFNKIY